MPTLNGRNFSGVPGINLREANGCVRFETPLITPTTTTGERLLYVNSSSQLIYDDGTTTHNITSGGGGSTTWDELYAADKTLNVNSTTLTYAGSHATNDVFTITNASGSGDCLQITNSGSGYDVAGTSSTWTISKTGAAVIQSSVTTPAIVSYGAGANANLTIDAKGTGTITLGATSTGAITLTRAVTLSSNLTITSGTFTYTAGDMTMSDGSLSITDADDAASLTVLNNSCATGNLVDINSDGITDGWLLHLDSNNGASFGTGGYLEVYDGSASCFTIARYGATVITGNGGTQVFTITGGDAVMSDGSLTITDADDAGSLSVTNNSNVGTNAALVTFATSGAYVGNTTKSVVYVNPSGLTTGTGFYMPVAAITQGKGMHLTSGATQTTGHLLYVQNTGASAALTSGTVATFDHTATAVGSSVNKTGSVVSVTSNRTVNTGGTTADDFDCLSVIKATTRTAGTAATAGSVLYVEMQTTGTVTETSKGIEVVMDSGGTGTGIDLTHNAATANGIAVTVDSLTTGLGITVDSSATAITGAGRLFYSNHTGATGTSAIMNEFASAATDETTILRVTASGALAAGVILDVSGAALTTGTAIDVSNLAAITEGKGLHIDASGTTQTTGILVHIDSAGTAMTGAGRLFLSDHTGATTTSGILNEFKTAATDETIVVQITADSLTTGKGLYLTANALTTGVALDMSNLSALTTGKAIHIDADGATQTDGILVHIDSAGTAISSTGRLLLVDHTGATTTSGIITELKTAGTDETVLLQLTAATLTTGTLLNVPAADALTTGKIANLVSNSSDNSTRQLVFIHNDHTSATGTTPLYVRQDAPTSTNYFRGMQFNNGSNTVTIWFGNGTSPNGSLSATAGDVCFGCDSGKSYYCTGTTNWTAL